MEVSPAGSIEYTDVTTGGSSSRDYNLEYKGNVPQADLTAVFKAHMLSDEEAEPTRNANQRKIAYDDDSTYHAVYQSAGEIWYVRSEDGNIWEPEELVSNYSHGASNPSIFVTDSSVYVTYMQDGEVALARKYQGDWGHYGLMHPFRSNCASTTPVVAAGKMCSDPYGVPEGDLVLVLWDNQSRINYELIWDYFGNTDTRDTGTIAYNAIDPPKYPSIDNRSSFLYYTAAWREGDVIKSAKLNIPSCNPVAFYLGQIDLPDVTMANEKAIYAPSITHNADHKPVIAYECKVPSILYSDRWVNVRTYDYTSGSWNTTVYHLPYYQFTRYNGPISPSVDAHSSSVVCGGGDIGAGLRVAYHQDWGGGIRVGSFECSYSANDQLMNGESFPNLVSYSPGGELREVYSAPFQTGPFMHALRATNAQLTKTCVPDMRMVRDLRLAIGGDISILGVTNLRVLHGNSVEDVIEWYEQSDTLVLGVDVSASELLRTETFTINNGDRFKYKSMLYSSNPNAMPNGVAIAVELRRASDDAILQQFALPLRSFPVDTAIWNDWSRNLSAFANETVYISLGIDGSLPGNATTSTAKVWLEGQYIPKASAGVDRDFPQPVGIELGQNHPNPFTGQTLVPFYLPKMTQIRLAVYNVMGQEVAVVTQGEFSAGQHELAFNANSLPAGTYLLKLYAGGQVVTRTMILTK
ncbi:T9SS type A sorting domain-containing protein [bacterium]|nr:T9SS type A sorting domain-containing protein [bacterium]